ncbi:MAG: aldo/keto reductase [Gemmatimonadales bacterium]|nr:aldo/keto reductase [Gemmatimonadales bacterium]MBA3555370.1 aldo/keto reductase [Gemmatimonadales bacterium]
MRQRPLGPGAPQVSAVGYGGMHLSIRDRPPEAQAVRVLHAVLDAGVTVLDTADVYCLDERDIGHNERLIAGALRSWSGARDAAVVATKGGLVRPGGRWDTDARPEQLRAACERSLRALGVERIDLYQLHSPDPRVPLEESVGALAELQSQGKIRWVGLSNVSVAEIERAGRIVPIVAVQNRLNPFFREALGEGVVAHCAAQGIGFLAYSPTGGGRLNLKLPEHPVLMPLAKRVGVSPHALVLAWIMSKSPTVIPIPSARRVEHALDSLRAADVELSKEDVAAIDRAEFSRA